MKALEDISENEEVFNCYGIDYRGMNREQRQLACRSLYHFECKCVICIDPSKEVVNEFNNSTIEKKNTKYLFTFLFFRIC